MTQQELTETERAEISTISDFTGLSEETVLAQAETYAADESETLDEVLADGAATVHELESLDESDDAA